MKNNKIPDDLILKSAKSVILNESKALLTLSRTIDKRFIYAVKKMSQICGKIVVIGIGKSGIIGRKIASTLSSIGIPSLYLHPVECLHGDMGMLTENDIVLALSYSGETNETNKLIPYLRHKGIYVISITNNLKSKLAKYSNITLHLNVKKEACPYNVVPTSSTTAMLALGDAITVVLMKIRGFDRTKFAQFHPGGNLGKLLNTRVRDIMRKGPNNPVVRKNQTLKQALCVMTKTKVGATSVVDRHNKLIGFFTDGDLRRYLQDGNKDINKKIEEVMTKNPVFVHPDTLAIDAAKIISERKIDNIPVIDAKNKTPIGIIDERDLLNEGII
jgi:arabinose-5-phosphate isomerase